MGVFLLLAMGAYLFVYSSIAVSRFLSHCRFVYENRRLDDYLFIPLFLDEKE